MFYDHTEACLNESSVNHNEEQTGWLTEKSDPSLPLFKFLLDPKADFQVNHFHIYIQFNMI